MAQAKKAKTGEKTGRDVGHKHMCPKCDSEAHIVRFAGFGPKGLFWVCDKADCTYTMRTG